ncbi:MAG: precorrin-2 dehydrogenase/sirohydrochlorin ferrochelatase family protein [Acidimicrobiales bacterium]
MQTPLFPVGLVLDGRRCLVVGGGMTAARKVVGLLDCGAQVTVVAPEVVDALLSLGDIEVWLRPFCPDDVDGFRLVISATGDSLINRSVFDAAEAAGVWVNSADDVQHCSFTLPAVLRHGPVTVAVATGGASPALAGWLLRRLAQSIGPEVGVLAVMLAEARRRLRDQGLSAEALAWASLLESDLVALLEGGQEARARSILADWVESQLLVSTSA